MEGSQTQNDPTNVESYQDDECCSSSAMIIILLLAFIFKGKI